MATTNAKVTKIWTLCTPDCEELGGHTSETVVCDRCGAHIHKRIFDIERKLDDGTYEHLSVGSECFKDAMGYSWKKAHDKALEVFEYFKKLVAGWNVKRSFVSDPDVIKRIESFRLYPGRNPELIVPRYRYNGGNNIRYGNVVVRPPHGFSKTLARAGEDLGLWRQDETGSTYTVKF